jgi:YD repeat-containing protein
VESDGTTTQYTYDADGNITSITRTAGTSTFSIGSISSSTGAAGSSVTITGTGFSSIASQDTVAFDGVSATITYASGNRLVVTVPAGAATGDITITTPNGTGSSTSPFTVRPLAITGLSPTSGADGTLVTVTGSGFDPTASNDSVSLNGTQATVSSASSTQLQFSVPGAMAGHVTVTTPLGSASSTGHFFLPASGYSASDIVSVADLTAGGPGQIYTTDTSPQVAVGLFDGSAAQMMTFLFTNVSMGGTYTIYAPDASTLTTGRITNNQFINLPPLPLSGTYSLYLVPGSSTGSATVSLQTDATGGLQTNGTPAAVPLAVGQNASYTFAGTAGQSYSLELTQFTSPPQAAVVASILNSNGTVAANCGAYYAAQRVPGNCDFTLPATGTYTVHLVQTAFYSTSFNLLLNQDFAATLTAGAPGPTVGITLVPGQHALLNFSATSGETLAFYLGSVNISPSTKNVLFTIVGPTGTTVMNGQALNGSSATANVTNLAPGTYSVLITPNNFNSAATTMQVALATGVTDTIPTDGTSTSIQTYVPGQNAYFTFSGTAAQSLGLGITGLTLTPNSANSTLLSIAKPDGSSLTSAACYTSSVPGCQVSLENLPETGTYTAVIAPSGQATQALALTLSQDLSGGLTLNQPTDVSLSFPGQYGDYTFTTNGNQPLLLYVGSLSTSPDNSAVLLYVYNSSGTLVTQSSISAGGTSVNLGTLPAASYSVLVVPNNAATATLQLALQPNASGALPPDGTPIQLATQAVGQNAYLSFSATAGQTFSLALTSLTLAPPSVSSVTIGISNPDGSSLTSTTCSTSAPGCEIRLRDLPQTGTYTAVIQPSGQATIGLTAALWSDATGTLTLGTPLTVTPQGAGQSAALSFALSTQQSVFVDLSSLSFTPSGTTVSESVYSSTGSLVGSLSQNSGTALELPNLSAGTYTIEIIPQYPVTGSFQALVASGIGASSFNTTTAGEAVAVSFPGTAGESLGLGVTGLRLSSGTSANITVTKPNGDLLVNQGLNANLPGTNFSFLNLPVTGTYTINIFPPGQQTMSVNVTLAPPVTDSLSLNTPQSVSLVAGQYTWMSFTATAGETVAVNESSIVTAPTGQNVLLTVYNSSGASVGSVGASGTTGTLNLTNLTAGTYYVMASPGNAASATFQLTVAPGVTSTQPVDGSSASYSTSEPGQDAYFQFSGTAGENIGIAITGLTVNTSNSANILVIEPNGSTLLLNTIIYGSHGNNFTLLNLPVTGTYSIEISPANAQQTMRRCGQELGLLGGSSCIRTKIGSARSSSTSSWASA